MDEKDKRSVVDGLVGQKIRCINSGYGAACWMSDGVLVKSENSAVYHFRNENCEVAFMIQDIDRIMTDNVIPTIFLKS